MRVMVVGGGAREHTLAWKLRSSSKVEQLYVAPGNAGTGAIAQNLDVSPTDIQSLASAAREHRIDLTVVGPEAPLAAGIVDFFQKEGLRIFGPTQAATRIESSKVFAKGLMQKYGIPCARGQVFSSRSEAVDYVRSRPAPIVIKADGLAAGKGVTVASSQQEALEALDNLMQKKVLGAAGEKVVIEERLTGKEVSLLAFTDGESVCPMVPACDYKPVFDGNRGPNTGGMGSYSPPAFFGQREVEEVKHTILEPAVRGMAQEGAPYIGVLYAGLMVTSDGVKVLEFNARFGDPETQVILPQLKTDLVDLMLATIEGRLGGAKMEWSDRPCVGVVMASGGYPGRYRTGLPITGLDTLDKDILVFHAGTAISGDNLVTSGGRVLTLVASGANLDEARARVYAVLPRVRFEGCHYRTDIAAAGAR
ncbi:MAG: phosphoribosylamine--glycine ligase [Chloroflexi bacterium]|nr:MAG: phosphoribosylamine--glycine ligase [Chloroflexota bacterium]